MRARRRSGACDAALDAMIRDRKRNVMPLENDRRFHLEMAEAGGNSALALLVRTLWDQRTGPLFLQLEHHFDTPDLWDAAIAEHQSVMVAHRSARWREGAYDDAPAYGPSCATIPEELDCRQDGCPENRHHEDSTELAMAQPEKRGAARARACADRERRVRRPRRADRHRRLSPRRVDCVRIFLGARRP